jgi:hypothetical protein
LQQEIADRTGGTAQAAGNFRCADAFLTQAQHFGFFNIAEFDPTGAGRFWGRGPHRRRDAAFNESRAFALGHCDKRLALSAGHFITALSAQSGQYVVEHPILKGFGFGLVATENDAVQVGFIDEGDFLFTALRKGVRFAYPLFIQHFSRDTAIVFDLQHSADINQAKPRFTLNQDGADGVFLESEGNNLGSHDSLLLDFRMNPAKRAGRRSYGK